MHTRIQKLLDLSQHPMEEDVLKTSVEMLVVDPYATLHIDDIEAAIDRLLINHKNDTSVTSPYLLGAFLFVCFTYYADKAELEDEANLKKGNKLLRSPYLRDFVSGFYDIHSSIILSEDMSLYKVGTTSYIIKLSPVGRDVHSRVLKLVKPYHCTNPLIQRETAEYKTKFDKIDLAAYAPEVISAGEKYIIMSFIPGMTLREHLSAHVWRESSRKNRILKLQPIFVQICKTLQHFSRQGQEHGDLSPDNIIIHKQQDKITAKFIDFGTNYILSENVAATDKIIQAQNYSATENARKKSSLGKQDKFLEDIYALAVTMLESLSDYKIAPRELYARFVILRNNLPVVSRFLDILLDLNAGKKWIAIIKDNHKASSTNNFSYDVVYEEIEKTMEKSLEAEVKIVSPNERSLRSLGLRTLDYVLGGFVPWLNQCRTFTILRSRNISLISPSRWALVTSTIALILHISILTACVALIFLDLRKGILVQNLPSRLICVSFSWVAVRYYNNIFAEVDCRAVSKPADTLLHLQSICFAGPIIYTLFDTDHWAYCAAVGVFVVTINNFYQAWLIKNKVYSNEAWLACHNGREVEKASDQCSSQLPIWVQTAINDMVNEFKCWWVPSLAYVIALCFVGWVLMNKNVSTDVEYAFAFGALIVNAMMYHRNCTKYGRKISDGLRYSYNRFALLHYQKDDSICPKAMNTGG